MKAIHQCRADENALEDLDIRAEIAAGVCYSDRPSATPNSASTFSNFRTRREPAVAVTSVRRSVR
jgi:hypothetical protein